MTEASVLGLIRKWATCGRSSVLGLGILLWVLTGAALGEVGSSYNLGMKVELSLSKSDISMGEPVYLLLRVTNVAATYRKSNFSARLNLSEGNDISVSVQPEHELPQRYDAAEDAAVYASTEMNLDTGETMEIPMLLLYDKNRPNGYLFGAPGTYHIKASVDATILREPTKFTTTMQDGVVTVHEPTGKNAEAWKLISNPETALSLQKNLTSDRSVLESCTKIALKYPDTVYAPECRTLMGLKALRQNPPEYTTAIDNFRKYLELYPGNLRAPEAAFTMVVLYTRMGKTDLARDWYYFTKDAYPTYSMLRAENPFASMYYFKLMEAFEANADRPWWLYSEPWVATPTAENEKKPAARQENGGAPASGGPAD